MAIQELDCIVYWNTGKAGGAGWDLLTNTDHTQRGVTSITSGSYSFILNYSFTATDIYSFVASVDESLGAKGVYIGTGPIGLTTAVCQIYQHPSIISGQVYWDGASFQVYNQTGTLAVRDWEAIETGELRLTHDECTEYGGNVVAGPGSQGIQVEISGQDSGQTRFKFYDPHGTQLTRQDSRMNFYFQRSTNGFGIAQPLSTVSGAYGGQFFITGIFEVA